MKEEKVVVILPAYNEVHSIASVIDEIRALPLECVIVVADSGSTDGTAGRATLREVDVIHCERGKGRATRQALNSVNGDYIFMMDSDYTYPARHLLPMLDMLKGGKLLPVYDAVYGWRHDIKIGAMPLMHKVANKSLNMLANMLYKPQKTHDLCSGMWGFTGDTAKFLAKRLTSNAFTLEADIFSSLARDKRRLGCVEISYRKRIISDSKIRIADGLKIAMFLITRRF